MLGKAVILPILMFALTSVFPLSAGKLKFIPIYKTLTIKANKKLPPHIAYMESSLDSQELEWKDFDKKAKQPLAVGLNENQTLSSYPFTQKLALEGLVIRKSIEPVEFGSERVYKTTAQAAQEIEGPQWLKNIIPERSADLVKAGNNESVHNLMAAKRITGPIELTQGLAVTNEHHIEIRRSNEGVFREMGQVDLAKGSYSIDIDEAAGAIVARLMNKSGAVLGEGSVRLNQLQIGEGRLVYGPRLEISPNPSWPGNVSYYYPSAKKDKADSPQVRTYADQNQAVVGKNGEISFEKMARNSTTIVRAEARDHMPTNRLMVAGAKPFDIPLFPTSMMEALRAIVADQKNLSQSSLSESPIVWGKISLDGKPISGVTIFSETEPEVSAIYFNEFMIPDPKLTSTSSNGLYAFVDLSRGFHALLAQRGGSYFGHQNVEAELGTVAVGDIENTLRTEPVRIRAFDAFSGEALSLNATLQSLSEPVQVVEGAASVVLPQVSRLSMMYTEAPPAYVSANYFYSDQESYIHLPMVSHEWLSELKTAVELNEMSQAGTIVGFFGEENFEAYLAGATPDSQAVIVYFDAAGKIVKGTQGVLGGGFVIFNVPYGTHEVVVLGTDSEKIYSRVVPVDMGTVSVLGFNSY